MLFNYEGNSLKSGIYEIRNRCSNRSYIGQAKEFKSRWRGHRSHLLIGRSNQFLQNDFNKCKESFGNDNFLEFHIIELMENSTKQERNDREEWWIREYKLQGYKVYNFCEKVSQSEDSWPKNPIESNSKRSQTLSGHKTSQETREKIAATLKGRYSGEKNPFFGKEHDSAFVEAQRTRNTKTYNVRLLSPEGVAHGPITNLKKFAVSHGMKESGMYDLVSKRLKSYYGWRLCEITPTV